MGGGLREEKDPHLLEALPTGAPGAKELQGPQATGAPAAPSCPCEIPAVLPVPQCVLVARLLQNSLCFALLLLDCLSPFPLPTSEGYF